ncbi:MAG: LysM peptidoglycan-binding domain-containing protein [Deltaproteobacteria bacterium]|nr:LysM peptidoglycan-binding domain-containing protein [Deltaproteobacteria bacterium]
MPESTEKQKQGWRQGILFFTVLMAFIFLGSWVGYLNVRIERQIVRLSQLVTENQKELKHYQQSQAQYQQRLEHSYHSLKILLEGLESEKETEEKRGEKKGTEKEEPSTFFQRFWPDFFWYKTSDTDTLWDISEVFYQHGRYYPVLMAMNPNIDIFEMKAAQQVKVLKDQGEVLKIYHQFVEKKDQTVIFLYQVREGDTPEGLSQKFYKTKDQYHRIKRVNPQVALQPGQRIRILLE